MPEWGLLATILIADDDPALLEALTMLLEALGYEVSATRSSVEALDRWSRARPDLVIVDPHMPGGGMELVKSICKETSIPVIVLSGGTQRAGQSQRIRRWSRGHLTKPFAAAELLARVRVGLRRAPIDGQPLTFGGLTSLSKSGSGSGLARR